MIICIGPPRNKEIKLRNSINETRKKRNFHMDYVPQKPSSNFLIGGNED